MSATAAERKRPARGRAREIIPFCLKTEIQRRRRGHQPAQSEQPLSLPARK